MKLYKSFNKGKDFTNYVGASSSVGKNKAFELNLYFALRLCFNLMIGYTTKCDHAGFSFRLDVFGLELEFTLYDTRHWNDDADRWYLPGEEQAEYEKNGPNIKYGNVGIDD